VQPKNHVDTTKPTEVTHLSLCTGYGGIDLGLRRCIPSLRTIAYAEIEASAIELLLARMEGGSLDAAPVWTNLRSFPWGAFSGRVDILSGGYPCQPFSAAGKRLGAEDERHLWPAIADGIRILRPRICFFENVEGHISLGLREVIAELEGLGYRTTWGIFSAAEVGAPHQRKRVFIMAYRKGEGLERHDRLFAGCGQSRWHTPEQARPACWSDSGRDAWQTRPGKLADSAGDRLNGSLFDREEIEQGQGNAVAGSCAWPSRPGEQQFWWEPPRIADIRQTESEVGGDADGPADWMDYAELCYASDNRTDELRMLGNGVVPATAAKAFETLMKELL
jgi:DNA (cytosine-5)-methyltransferase 1